MSEPIIAELATRLDTLTQIVASQGALLQRLLPDEAKLEELLAEISFEIGDEPFHVGTLFDIALGIGGERLLQAIGAVIDADDSGSPRRRLGKYLSKHIGVSGDRELELVKARTNAGGLYRVSFKSPNSLHLSDERDATRHDADLTGDTDGKASDVVHPNEGH